ncbi:class I SAM-dependent methyltransferase [Aerosakkonemataceae cyanobacterium BLCC-F154]|uniref:Class I SAM-dependent methyltransferase n=1 Tax=Floridaenema fluviatile BLCC-F154 TaxID=3153640 RepID=A0ABV4YE34_9CYAN
MQELRTLPNWEKFYQEKQVEKMGWFSPELDSDLQKALIRLNWHAGTVLDLGTGPGTQAIALAKLGFQVTATDISPTAIEKAKKSKKAQQLNIIWKQDDILNHQLKTEFDWIFDRGCFHVFHPYQRETYVQAIATLLKPNGCLFLKCFSAKRTINDGPYQFQPEEIAEIFRNKFRLISLEETVYQGTVEPFPPALFCILQKLD